MTARGLGAVLLAATITVGGAACGTTERDRLAPVAGESRTASAPTAGRSASHGTAQPPAPGGPSRAPSTPAVPPTPTPRNPEKLTARRIPTSAPPADPSGPATPPPRPTRPGGSSSPPPAAPSMAAGAENLFGAGGIFTRSIRRAAAGDGGAVEVLARDARDRGAGVSFERWNVSFYRVPPGTPRVPVRFADCYGDGIIPPVFTAALSSVPIPAGALPAAGDDRHLSIYAPDTDQLWELWRAERTESGWQACWGGRIDDVSRSSGSFPDGTGAAGSGLALAGSMITMAEVRAGRIGHAMSLVVPTVRADAYSWPANRTDGRSDDPNAPMEGQLFRLDPAIDVDSLSLSPFGRMVARAAQEYGFIVVDQSAAVGVVTESGLAQKTRTGTDPWTGLLRLDRYDKYDLMDGFPWQRLQAMPKDYGR
ncbi:hypothetical protein [Microlunatus sp. GCM10028923]|uniref:hypothetical protein n=1 Tax=Microlunatus sp. GCM10028923 TaxID=3273400 RepID=UPI0036163F58